MGLTDEQKKELDKARKKSASYRQWYEANKERVAAQRKARYENDPEYRERILANRRKQREKEKHERSRREVKGNVLENRRIKQFQVNHDELGSVVTQFYSIGQMAKRLNLAVPTMRKWEREGVIPEAMYRSNGGHRLYTVDQVNTISEVYEKHLSYTIAQKTHWKLSDEFRAELNERLSELVLGVKRDRFVK